MSRHACGRSSNQVERPLETRGVQVRVLPTTLAERSPARLTPSHDDFARPLVGIHADRPTPAKQASAADVRQIFRGSVAQTAEQPTLNRPHAGSSPAGVTLLEGLPLARYPVSKTGGLRPWGFDSLSFRPSFRCSRAVRRATVNREAQVRTLPPEFVARPCGRTGMTPDSQSGSCGFDPRRGYSPIEPRVEIASHSRHHVRHRAMD